VVPPGVPIFQKSPEITVILEGHDFTGYRIGYFLLDTICRELKERCLIKLMKLYAKTKQLSTNFMYLIIYQILQVNELSNECIHRVQEYF